MGEIDRVVKLGGLLGRSAWGHEPVAHARSTDQCTGRLRLLDRPCQCRRRELRASRNSSAFSLLM